MIVRRSDEPEKMPVRQAQGESGERDDQVGEGGATRLAVRVQPTLARHVGNEILRRLRDDVPGLGIKVNEAALAKFTVIE